MDRYTDTKALEKQAQAIWDTNVNLRAEFGGRQADFLAWVRAAGKGLVKQTTGRAVKKHSPEKK